MVMVQRRDDEANMKEWRWINVQQQQRISLVFSLARSSAQQQIPACLPTCLLVCLRYDSTFSSATSHSSLSLTMAETREPSTPEIKRSSTATELEASLQVSGRSWPDLSLTSSIVQPSFLSPSFQQSTRPGGVPFEHTKIQAPSASRTRRPQPVSLKLVGCGIGALASLVGAIVYSSCECSEAAVCAAFVVLFLSVYLLRARYGSMHWRSDIRAIPSNSRDDYDDGISRARNVLTECRLFVSFMRALAWYKKQAKHARKPKRIILIRHAHSEGNVDPTVYSHVPDNRVQLTAEGRQQAKAAGSVLRSLLGNETVRFFVSPYTRSQQTFESILERMQLDESRYSVREDPRLREQDWGNLQDPEAIRRSMQERRAFGAFYYRFPNGESGADVYDRVDSFWSSLNREMKFQGCLENFVIVSHGITIRLLLMRYFKWTVDEFHQLWNPENCQMAVLQLQSNGKYSLREPLLRNPTC